MEDDGKGRGGLRVDVGVMSVELLLFVAVGGGTGEILRAGTGMVSG